jgi:hypothetical protein
MPRDIDIIDGLRSQYRLDAKAIQQINGRLNNLRPLFQEYLDLSDQLTSLEDRAKVTYLMLSSFTQWNNDAEEPPPEVLGIAFERDVRREKASVPTWKAMREVVRQSLKIRIVQVQELLREFGHKASRQAIESALATHRGTFQVTITGREKFVSLR